MAISPFVQQFQQGQIQNQQNLTPEHLGFNKKFGEAAYEHFRTKYPTLMPLVVLFKVIESDTEQEFGFGVFVLREGEDVVYTPTVLSGGKISSCEMVYRKDKDNELVPLIPQEIKSVLGKRMLQEPTLVRSPRIENTRKLFHDMFRPPASSSPVLASGSPMVSQLPDRAKQALSEYLIRNPETLGKVSGFYPVDLLASKLAAAGSEKVATDRVKKPTVAPVIRLDQLTKDAAAQLTTPEKEEVLKRGWVVKAAWFDTMGPDVLSMRTLPVNLVARLNLIEKPLGTDLHGRGYVLRVDNQEIVADECLVAGSVIITRRGISDFHGNSQVVAAFRDGITYKDLLDFGAVAPTEFTPKNPPEKGKDDCCTQAPTAVGEPDYAAIKVFYPTKTGEYRLHRRHVSSEGRAKEQDYSELYIYPDRVEKEVIDGDVVLRARNGGDTASFIKGLSTGSVRMEYDHRIFPANALIWTGEIDKTRIIPSLQALYNLMLRTNARLRMFNDGAGVSLKNTKEAKVASFTNEADLVEHLVSKHHFSKEAVDLLLKDQDVLVLEKTAFPMGVSGYGDFEQAPAAGAGDSPYGEPSPVLNEDLLQASAEVGDQDLYDVGMLASLAGDENIKTNLLDMLPIFSETVTNLGKAILIFTINQDEMEKQYSSEDYNSLLNNMRKIFKTLGEIIYDLKQYIHMN